ERDRALVFPAVAGLHQGRDLDGVLLRPRRLRQGEGVRGARGVAARAAARARRGGRVTGPARVGPVGARGYVGRELVALIARHPGLELAYVASTSRVGAPVAA